MKYPKTEDQSEDFQMGFVAGLFFQAMRDGRTEFKHSISPDGVAFVSEMAETNGYDAKAIELEDGLTDVTVMRR